MIQWWFSRCMIQRVNNLFSSFCVQIFSSFFGLFLILFSTHFLLPQPIWMTNLFLRWLILHLKLIEFFHLLSIQVSTIVRRSRKNTATSVDRHFSRCSRLRNFGELSNFLIKIIHQLVLANWESELGNNHNFERKPKKCV